nr:hypothetical protein [uncultured Carboxylicivirga sp.]
MNSLKKREELIIDYLSDTLSEADSIVFNELYADDSEFALEVDECVGTYVEIISWQQSVSSLNDTNKPTPMISVNLKKGFMVSVKYAAAAIGIVFITLYFTRQFKPSYSNRIVITQSDTVYLPKKEYYKVHQHLLAKNYQSNPEMDRLVALSNQTQRGIEICAPTHNYTTDIGEKVYFNLTKFKPGSYRLQLLGFEETINVVDTIYSKRIHITEKNKLAYTWTPNVSGVYYWMIFVERTNEPFLVRKINIKP